MPDDTRERDVEELFEKFGKITRVALREGRNAKMAFLEYDNRKDAEDAIERRHEYEYRGNRIRCELSTGAKGGGREGGKGSRGGRGDSRRRGGRGGRDSRRRGRSGRDNSRRRGGGERGGRKGKGKDNDDKSINPHWHKVAVSGMPAYASWQDMKDFFRPVEAAKYTNVTGNGEGEAGFATRQEAERVCDKLDGEDFKDRDGNRSKIKLRYEPKDDEEEKSGGRGGRSRSRSERRSERKGSDRKGSDRKGSERKGSEKRGSREEKRGSRDEKRSRSEKRSGSRSGGDRSRSRSRSR